MIMTYNYTLKDLTNLFIDITMVYINNIYNKYILMIMSISHNDRINIILYIYLYNTYSYDYDFITVIKVM